MAPASKPVVSIVMGSDSDLGAAVEHAYEATARIHFDGIHYRKDIAMRTLAGRT